MSKTEIDQLKAEAGIDPAAPSPSPWSAEAGPEAAGDSLSAETAGQGGEAPAEETALPETPAAPVDRASLVLMVDKAVAALSRPICRRARVTELHPAETEALAGALADLAIVYDLAGRMDPRTAAWFAFGLVFSGIVANRERIGEPAPAAPSQPAGPDSADTGPTFPLDAAQSYSGA